MEKEKLICLVRRAQAGEPEAMDALFAAYYNDVYYFALKTVKDSDIACDITQDTFLEVLRNIGQLNEPAAFAAWMKQIAYHQCTRYFSKKKEVLVEEDEDGNTIFDTLADESEGSVPSEVVEQEEFRQTILAMIDELTEEQRAAVMLYYFDELTVGQIARIQGVSEGTVKSRLNYARKAIKKSVESYEQKHNIKLHSFALLPLLLLLFGKELMPKAQAATIRTTVYTAARAGTPATASAISAAGASAAGASAATETTVGSTAASGGFLSTLAGKLLVGAVVGALSLGVVGTIGAAVVVGVMGVKEMADAWTASYESAADDSQSRDPGEIRAQFVSPLYTVAVSDCFVVAIQQDGSAMTDLNLDEQYDFEKQMQKDVSGWTDLISVVASEIFKYGMGDEAHVVGLRSDGTVVATGDNSHGECQVQDWTDIAAVFADTDYTVGLKKDGTLVYTPYAYWVEDYLKTNDPGEIASISCNAGAVGVLRKDGTVWLWDEAMNEAFAVTDVVQLDVRPGRVIALRSDGTVQSYGCCYSNGCECKNWKDMVQVAMAPAFQIGMKADGTIEACGFGFEGEPVHNWMKDWSEVAQIYAGGRGAALLQKDGTLIMDYGYHQWLGVRVPGG